MPSMTRTSVSRVAAACAALGGLLFAVFLLGEAPHAADFGDITRNLGLISAVITAGVTAALYLDWPVGWLLALPAGLWLLFIGLAPSLFDEFTGPAYGGLIGFGGIGLVGSFVARLVLALGGHSPAEPADPAGPSITAPR